MKWEAVIALPAYPPTSKKMKNPDKSKKSMFSKFYSFFLMISGGLRKVSVGEKMHTQDILSTKSGFVMQSKFPGGDTWRSHVRGGLGGQRPPRVSRGGLGGQGPPVILGGFKHVHYHSLSSSHAYPIVLICSGIVGILLYPLTSFIFLNSRMERAVTCLRQGVRLWISRGLRDFTGGTTCLYRTK